MQIIAKVKFICSCGEEKEMVRDNLFLDYSVVSTRFIYSCNKCTRNVQIEFKRMGKPSDWKTIEEGDLNG